MEFTTTGMGQQKLLRNRYIYVHRRILSEGSSMWNPVCIYGRKGKHTHAPCQTECQVTKVKAGIKRQAAKTEETMQQILGRNISEISPMELQQTYHC